MEKYRKIVKWRMALLTIPVIFAIGLFLYQLSIGSAKDEDFLLGFQMGIASTLCVCSLIYIINYFMILRDEKKLRLEYNKENDERYKLIRAKSGQPLILFISVTLMIAGIIAGYFNFTIFVTLITVAMFQSICSAAVKLYYCKKL